MSRVLTPAQRAERLALIADHRAAGMNSTTMAPLLGVSPNYLRNWIQNEAKRQEVDAAAATKPRQCLGCVATFDSEGPHNRMCPNCRARSMSPMCPDPGGSTGRRVNVSRAGRS